MISTWHHHAGQWSLCFARETQLDMLTSCCVNNALCKVTQSPTLIASPRISAMATLAWQIWKPYVRRWDRYRHRLTRTTDGTSHRSHVWCFGRMPKRQSPGQTLSRETKFCCESFLQHKRRHVVHMYLLCNDIHIVMAPLNLFILQ